MGKDPPGTRRFIFFSGTHAGAAAGEKRRRKTIFRDRVRRVRFCRNQDVCRPAPSGRVPGAAVRKAPFFRRDARASPVCRDEARVPTYAPEDEVPEPTCEPGVGEREPLCGPRDEVRDGVPDEPHDEQGPAYTPHRWDRAGAEDIRPEGKDNRRQQAMHAYHTSDDASEQLRHADGRAFTRASRRKHLPRCRTCRSRQIQPCRNHPSLRGNGRRSAAARAKAGTAPNLHPPNGAIFRRFPANPPNGFSSSSRDDSPAAEVCVRGAGRISAPHRDEEAEQRIRPEQNLCREAQQHRNES